LRYSSLGSHKIVSYHTSLNCLRHKNAFFPSLKWMSYYSVIVISSCKNKYYFFTNRKWKIYLTESCSSFNQSQETWLQYKLHTYLGLFFLTKQNSILQVLLQQSRLLFLLKFRTKFWKISDAFCFSYRNFDREFKNDEL
jgi:hypothetical protein